MVSASLVTPLRDTLRAGLSVVQEVWNYKAKDWITSVHAADINNDGHLEIIICSRDGRVRAFDKDRNVLWKRVVGSKAWVGAIAGIEGDDDIPARIIVGTRDGKVYAFAEDGQTVGRDGRLYAFGKDGKALDREAEIASCWLDTKAAVRQIFVNPTLSPDIIVGSEDGCAYAINIRTGEQHWVFPADGWVRAVYHSDIDGDGRVETIIGSNEKSLFVLSDRGKLLRRVNMRYPIHAVFAADIDDDGEMEILVATDGKDLVALSPRLDKKWFRVFDNRILALYVADINEDGQEEIIAGSEDRHVYILNQQGERLWRHNVKYRVISVYAADINNDDRMEILVGAGNDRAYAYHVDLIDGLEKRIRGHYEALRKALKNSPTDLTQVLRADELRLLHDLLGEEGRQREELKHITFKEVNRLMTAGQYYDALVSLIKMEQYRIELQLRKGKQDGLENIRSLCIGRMNNGKRSVVVGTNDGNVYVLTVKGRRVGEVSIDERILDVQTGYINQDQLECIIVCTSNHKVYILPATGREGKYEWELGYETACIYVNKGNRQRPSEILTGTDTTIMIYGEGIETPSNTIHLKDDVGLVHAYARTEQEMPEVIAASANRSVYACRRRGMCLWDYEVWDRVQALDMKDIDRDNEVEVIVGSEDRNLHVLDSHGKLRWRFFLPHSVLAVQAIDVDQDGQIEILAGCANGWLYVFSKDGDLLWKYHASDRIRALKAEDVDDDGNIEIVVGAEDELEILSVVNREQVRGRIEQCLVMIQQGRSLEEMYGELLQPTRPDIPFDPELRAFAIIRLAKLPNQTSAVFGPFEPYVKDNYVSVRKAVIQAVVACYLLDPQQAMHLLNQLAQDGDLEVRLAFIEQMPVLMERDWRSGFAYLERFFVEGDRMGRRAVVRQLNRLIDMSQEYGAARDIFILLLKAAQDEDSEWIRQEAARALGHFLDSYRERLIIYMHLFLVNELRPEVMELIGHYATIPLVRKFVSVVMPFFSLMGDDQILDNLQKAVQVVQEMSSLEYGKDLLKMYEELYRLFAINTIEGIAAYHCALTREDFGQDNGLAAIILDVLKQVGMITRCFGIYLRREGIFDRLASLLDAQKAIDEVGKFVERIYSGLLMGYSIKSLPDHLLFVLLLQRWQTMVLTQLHELRGGVELKVELQTKIARSEERVAVLFKVSNTGRRAADNVKVSLLHSDDFDIIGNLSVEMETLLSYETLQAEFTLKLQGDHLQEQQIAQNEFTVNYLRLRVEVAYEDAEHRLQTIEYADQLELFSTTVPQEFYYIPNPYSTGTPVQDSIMFYGRDDDVAALRHNLADTAAKTVMLLYGQRRMGKTTLLLHLVRTDVLREHIPVFIDMQRESYNISVNKFLHNVAYYIAQAINNKGYTMPLPEIKDYAVDPTFVFDIFLDHVETRLHAQRVIILIDEFEMLEDQIKKGNLKPEFLDYLRSIMQHHHLISFLLAGTHQLEQLTQANWSVFFNIARQYRLSKLSQRGAEDLIKKPVANHLEYGLFTVEKIRSLTADQPYLIHLLCRALVDLCNEQRKVYVTINDVNAARREAMQTCASHFDWLWKHLTFDEQRLLAVISELSKEEGRWLFYSEIEERYRYHHFSYERKSLYDWIKLLRVADIVEIASEDAVGASLTDERLRIPAGLMRMWLLREKPLRLLTGEQQATVS